MRFLLFLAACWLPFNSPAQTLQPAATAGQTVPQVAPEPSADPPSANCCRSRYLPDSLGTRSTAALGQEYRRLKRSKCPACNFYGSDFQKLLRALGGRLKGASAAEIKRVMGPPDTIKVHSLVYYWRGEHDYLQFTFPYHARAVGSWYYAYE